MNTNTENIKCCYYNVGYCKNKSECKYFHPEVDCDINCSSTKCNKRHRKQCIYGNKCHYLSLENCEFKHTHEVITKINYKNENKKLESKINELNQIINNKETKIKEMEERIQTLVKHPNLPPLKIIQPQPLAMDQSPFQSLQTSESENEENKRQNKEEIYDKTIDEKYAKYSKSKITSIKQGIKVHLVRDNIILSSENVKGMKINIYQCIKCSKTFKNDKAVAIHYNENHDICCHICSKKCYTNEDLSSHMQNDHNV